MRYKFGKTEELNQSPITLFRYHYNYVHPLSDLGLSRHLQEIQKQRKENETETEISKKGNKS